MKWSKLISDLTLFCLPHDGENVPTEECVMSAILIAMDLYAFGYTPVGVCPVSDIGIMLQAVRTEVSLRWNVDRDCEVSVSILLKNRVNPTYQSVDLSRVSVVLNSIDKQVFPKP